MIIQVKLLLILNQKKILVIVLELERKKEELFQIINGGEDLYVNPNDGDEYIVIDLEKLDGITLHYGYDKDGEYFTLKNNKSVNQNAIEDEIYVINTKTHQIYFPHGIFVDNVMYYTVGNAELVQLESEPPNDIENRDKIKVGDYIKYTSPTSSVKLEANWTGHTDVQNLPAKNMFRVLEKKEDGTLILIGDMKEEDQKIHLSGVIGYNNAVYTLNTKCSELYKDESKGITARSINGEDITNKLNQSGKNRFEQYINTFVNDIKTTENMTKGTKEDGVTLDNTVTYSNTVSTNCPDIFQYESGGKINGVPTLEKIKQNESYSGYNGITNLTTITPIPNSLTVTQTYVNTSINDGYFDDKDYCNIIFNTDAKYWIASRYVGCSETVSFMIGQINRYWFSAWTLYNSSPNTFNREFSVCPIVTIPSNVKVTIGNGASTSDGTPHEVK